MLRNLGIHNKKVSEHEDFAFMLYDLLLPNFGILSYRILGFHIVPPSSRFIFLFLLLAAVCKCMIRYLRSNR